MAVSRADRGEEGRGGVSCSSSGRHSRGGRAADNNNSGSIPNNFAGGPISGGSKTHINEFGQEAFLSAAGKLSMINAPAWGEWRPPSSGTVIPAHVTKQLSIPSGGTSVNRAAASQVNKAGASGGAMMRALRGLTGGSSDRITNNVTIQAANTTQAASDMLVNLTKLRRRR